MKKENLKGQKFNKLLVLEPIEDLITKKGKRVTRWVCLCECGNRTIVASNNLKSNRVKSCGCLKGGNFKHNQSNSRLYDIWSNMVQRCNNSNNKSYKDYGARGIKICKEWGNNFENFYNWAINNGYQDNLTIERINVNGNYESNNCKWASKIEQAHNKRNNRNIVINGEKRCITEWGRMLNLSYYKLRKMMKLKEN